MILHWGKKVEEKEKKTHFFLQISKKKKKVLVILPCPPPFFSLFFTSQFPDEKLNRGETVRTLISLAALSFKSSTVFIWSLL